MNSFSDVCNWLTLAGAITAYGLRLDLKDKAFDVLKRTLKCSYPTKRLDRSSRFLRLQMQLVKAIQQRLGWKCQRLEYALRRYALTLDSFLDNLKKIRNPFCFLEIDNEMAEDLNLLLDVCTIPRPLPYRFIFMDRNPFRMQKITEGSYGEVYRISRHNQEDRIIKAITANGFHYDFPRDGYGIHEVISDAVCSRYLSKLRDAGEYQAHNFPILHSIYLVDGKPPEIVLDSWNKYEVHPGEFENDRRPDGYSMCSLFLVIELEFCGETFFDKRSMTYTEALSVVLQTASAMAIAEEAYEFEHRDLHGGNLLYKETSAEYLEYNTPQKKWKIKSKNIQAFIIDFTMSRMNADGRIVYLDLSYLENSGTDTTAGDFSFHPTIYDLMETEINGDYKKYIPRTNILWLKHIVEYVYLKLQFLHTCHFDEFTRSDVLAMKKLADIKVEVMNYSSTIEFLHKEILDNETYNDYVSRTFNE